MDTVVACCHCKHSKFLCWCFDAVLCVRGQLIIYASDSLLSPAVAGMYWFSLYICILLILCLRCSAYGGFKCDFT